MSFGHEDDMPVCESEDETFIDQRDIDYFEGYVGANISFPSGSVWTLKESIGEHAYYEVRPEVRGAFIASKVSGDGPATALIKIRLQIPDYSEATYLANIRPGQAVEAPHNFSSEIEALSLLTKAGCSCTPSLYDWKKDKQTDQEPVPRGYKLFILMELLPGIMPEDLFFSEDSEDGAREERDELRSAFKKSWL
ncbi:hypothetical protein N7456_001594 [Penicillium angulare]|uniref:Uncharacterized protein n=1 Tax=Penicillium angulare TaxID=116970 RepID=A0A9W9G7J2_9EURO|nr:hypothetical protein N7456_001594 [Penicillium angulare]